MKTAIDVTRGRLAVVVLMSLAAAAGAAAGATVTDGSADRPVAPQVDVSSDSVVITVSVRDDGTGVWEVAYRQRLDDENATSSFESYRQRVDERPVTVTGPFRDEMAAAATQAESATGREMGVDNVSVTARRTSVPEEFGVVTFRFEWERFAATDGDRLRAGPALSDFFLTEETTLFVGWPDGYERVQVTPAPDETRNGSVAWTGPKEFAAGEPLTVLEPRGGTGPSTTVLLGGLAVAGLGLLVVGGLVARRQRGAGESPTSEQPPAGATAQDGGGTGGATEVPSELLSSEERVLELLDSRGGRVKQQQVVEAFEWSETKTSHVVNDLQDAGKVEVYRIGRENVVALPGEMDV